MSAGCSESRWTPCLPPASSPGMTATGFPGLTPGSRFASHFSPFRQRLPRFGFCSKKKSEAAIQGRLRIKSLPGAFLILGVVVVLVGTAVAVAGYWPRAHRAGTQGQTAVNGSRVVQGRPAGARSLPSAAGLIHSDRMKLLGPIVMGVGLFIFICANTMLYENRDRETQLLLAQAAIKAAVPADGVLPALDGPLPLPPQLPVSLTATELNICCLEDLADSESLLLQVGARGSHWASGVRPSSTLLTEALHHHGASSPPISLRTIHSDSCNSSVISVNIPGGSAPASPQSVSSMGAVAAPLIKLNNYPVDTPPGMSRDDEWGAPMLPRRAYSLSCRTNPREHQPPASRMGALHAPVTPGEPFRKEFSSDMCLSTAALDPRGTEEQKHRSWPRLDLSMTRRYQKLENAKDSGDKLEQAS